jgi:putative transposase
VRTVEAPRFTGKLLSATVSTRAGKWFVSLSYEFEKEDVEVPAHTVGIDLGIKTLATLSTGQAFQSPKALSKNLYGLRALNKHLSRKVKGSKNWNRCKNKLSKLHFRVSNIRTDNAHKVTTEVAKNHSTVVLETLSIKEMLKNKKLSRAISDCGFYELKRQLLYKCLKVIEADRFYPSSKLCSSCGSKKDILLLSERTYKCTSCSLCINRDLNAALNLSRLA